MTRDKLEEIVSHGESETLEFKLTTGMRREGCQSLCAMLNHRGGRVLFGVDQNGNLIGQEVSDRSLEALSEEIARIEPPALPATERVSVDAKREVLVVTAPQGQGRPYSYRNQAYKRIGNTTRQMSRDEYNRMLIERLHGEQRWENQPLESWTVRDLDVSELTKTIDEAIRRGRIEDPGTREPHELLRGLGLFKDDRPVRAAAVLFGNPERLEAEFPQCLLRVARFKGTDKTEFIDNRQFHGHAFRLLTTAERFIREHVPIAGRVVPMLFERVDDPLYPPSALREAIANAICHRDYSIGGGSVAVAIFDDRLEVTSSGTLHFGLTTDALFEPHESLPFNPLVARVLYRRGIIEQWGRGTLKMVELAERAGLPRPQIEEIGGSVRVRFRSGRGVTPERIEHALSPRQQEILGLLRSGPMALRELRSGLSHSAPEEALKADLILLRGLHLVGVTGRGKGSTWHLLPSGTGRPTQ